MLDSSFGRKAVPTSGDVLNWSFPIRTDTVPSAWILMEFEKGNVRDHPVMSSSPLPPRLRIRYPKLYADKLPGRKVSCFFLFVGRTGDRIVGRGTFSFGELKNRIYKSRLSANVSLHVHHYCFYFSLYAPLG
ncbi:hypothetical protein GWI33_020346 [Rhynchophorus ferrugineus]|uniref:Uncharacterized protein n=1 Tax=Rhynchophorus ferrugineus TaxID=354439 RepID=A0A834HRB2_RHYFE|nr:hypothetical protein GWI33_020346 [Rhynchophorus ferrugineus]